MTREAIYYGPADSSFLTSLVSWALPYAQCYIYSVHQKEYYEFKQSGLKNLNSLSIVVVEKLFYKNIIKKYGIESNKRGECSCLLQDNILYATRETDAHSLFMELSRFLVAGIPELHLSNFLHMITTMAEVGSTDEHLELFISNSQKLMKLPSEELHWLLGSAPPREEDKDIPTTRSGLSFDDMHPPKSSTRKFGKNSSWPPVIWKTAPVSTEHAVILKEDEASIDHSDSGINMNAGFSAVNRDDGADDSSSHLIERDQLNWGTITPQQVITGRTGEDAAFKYFSEKLGKKSVRGYRIRIAI